ncbi:uncharacterized protein LOC120560190 [Perca fluviatilis]|uniref:uncharacterized protein LOC120560190 n=1 Tax=Perca fluviatilis TaxID=8168 RepID=UPI00196690C9|nr:uncharacterized protein LOC120560190 [Perca fluviatilis]
MANWMKRWRLLILFSLLSLTELFEVRYEEWEELSPDIAALHQLRGLSIHMFHENIRNPPNHRSLAMDFLSPLHRNTSIHGARVERSISREDIDQNPMSLLSDLQENEKFTASVIQKEQDFEGFLAAIDKQKTQDVLLSALEISHSYSQKLLVMTDKEKSTNDRVQQEYSMDPHYSVIVSNECLFNVSCVPEADSYTLVKIFGSVSEDGQTVSGLSGSSLAELMLKPSLETAPVFSLDGNTTKDFQHNLIRVFTARGITAVLETNQENHQTYQVMNQLEEVTGYQIPQRPVDHSTQYDHQQILILEDDPVVRKAATYLNEKHPTVSSVYVLDDNQRPVLIRGDSVPLTEDSRLVLVGHGRKDNSGEMRLAGYEVQEVSTIIKQTSRDSNKIKTITVVACDVGSDKAFIETLLKDLHDTAGIETELHIRDAVLQVRHTGEKITQEITKDGEQWRHEDDSKKVVATLDRNGDVIIRNEPGSKGKEIFTAERNFLGPKKNHFLVYRDSWPDEPRRFITQNVFGEDAEVHKACDELEALSWGFFHNENIPAPEKIKIKNLDLKEYYLSQKKRVKNEKTRQYEETGEVEKINNKQKVKDILSNCYEIKSGEDIRNVIRHYAKTGEDEVTYLKVNDWILEVNPKYLYVAPIGKKLDNNERGNEQQVKKCIEDQIGKESYSKIREGIKTEMGQNDPIKGYAQYVEGIFCGEPTTPRLPLPTEAWCTTYFTASVISESARNFRTFPLTLMALDMVQSTDNNIKENGLNFLWEEHSMARGGSWIDPSRRGFSGSADYEVSSKSKNYFNPSTPEQLMDNLKYLITKEVQLYSRWIQKEGGNNPYQILDIAKNKYRITERNSVQDYKTFTKKLDNSDYPASGGLGGFNDGHVTSQDLKSSSELEKSFKLESYYSRQSVLTAEQVHSQLKAKYGESLAGLQVQEGSARMENEEFVCHLLDGADAKPVEFRAKLSPESQRYYETMSESIETAVHDMENHGSISFHQGSKYVEHAGHAVGTLGLMLGLKGAVRAFEQGDFKDAVVGSLQTAHGVTAMTSSVIAKKALSSEARMAKAVTSVMKSPAMKGFTSVIPIVGIGFGIYNLEQDLERGDALGNIDAALDGSMVVLDVIETAQPELVPLIMPINLALSVVRMVNDEIYMGIQNELNNLPKDAGVLEKLGAVSLGFLYGIQHFGISVASFFYDWHYDEIEQGNRLVAQISDYNKYYKVTKQKDGTSTVDFSGGDSSGNGGGVHFCLADQGPSELCMDYFVSSNESFGKRCWQIDTQGSKDIILGLGESKKLEYMTLQKKILWFIPAGSVTVVSGYKAVPESRFGEYKGNRDSNRFFAIQKAEDEHVIEVMLSYYYRLYGEPGDDIFFLGPQRSYVEGCGGKDTYIIPKNGGKTAINNYDPSKALDTLHLSVDYSDISVSKSGNDVVLMYEGSHTVTIEGWFLGEPYRHMNMMSGDGVLFEISSVVVSSVQLMAVGINKMFSSSGGYVDASQPLLSTVTNIVGSQGTDFLYGNGENNIIDGGGGYDWLIGREGEDMYIVKVRKQSLVSIINYSKDTKTDLAIIEANLHTFRVEVMDDHLFLNAFHDNTSVSVVLMNWFRSAADRHLFVVTKDLITFTISDNKADCLDRDPFTKCIKSSSIDYSSSPSPLLVDLQEDETFSIVMEVHGSNFNDAIRGNKEHNVIVPGGGDDFIQGRGGEDWYVITPGQGVKTINNQSPNLALDILFLEEEYENIMCSCEGQSIIILVHGRKDVILQNWFDSKFHQHLQIKTSDGITAGLMTNRSSCDDLLMFPVTIDYRNQKPEPLNSLQTHLQKHSISVEDESEHECFTYRRNNSQIKRVFCGLQGTMMNMNNHDSVKEMYGSSGFDIMVGNSNENLLDPYTGGALMFGGEGKDTYVIKQGYGNDSVIDNFAEDQNIDTVLVDMDYLHGSQVTLDSSTEDLKVTITSEGEQFKFTVLNYTNGYQHQHLEFQSSDGVNFKLKSLNSTGDVAFFDTEAFKVTLKQLQVDCRLDLNSQRNLSKVHTVQGCPSQSNNILGNDQDNALIGGWKDDALEGGAGDDTLIGGNGDDILIGGLGDDTLYGEDGNDTMMGNSGQDVFLPGPGADLVDGGPGRDTVVYRGDHDTGKGVYVNLLTGQGRYADAEGDVLKDVEIVIGTVYSDILVSGYESSLLKGSDGNDILVSTGGDYLVGGDGNDIYMLAFNNGSVTVDNCAKDNATDVLYMSSQSTPPFDCQLLSDRDLLTFFGFNQTTVKITLQGWISDENECGHLKLVFRDQEVSVDRLLQECQLRQKKSVWSLVIEIIYFLFFFIFSVFISRTLVLRAKQQKKREQTDVDAESVSLLADEESYFKSKYTVSARLDQ